jgi:hypothetical protein
MIEQPLSETSLKFFPIDDGLAVFSEEAQKLVGLNASSAFIINALRQGKSEQELVQSLAGQGLHPQQAMLWLNTTRAALQSALAVDAAPSPDLRSSTADTQYDPAAEVAPYAPVTAVTESSYRLLDAQILIRYSHWAQRRAVNAAIGHLETDKGAEPTGVIEIQGSRIEPDHFRSEVYMDQRPIGRAPRLYNLAPLVKSLVWDAAVRSYDFLFYLHAGVVGSKEGCVILPAAAGSGKSSLTLALTQRGYPYFSDEVALIDRATFLVPPMPLAMCIKDTGWEVAAPYRPEIRDIASHRRSDGKLERYLAPPSGATKHAPAPVSHIFFPRYDAAGPTELRPVPRADALRSLMGECLALRQRLDEPLVHRIVQWISGIDCFDLPFSSLDAAADLIGQIIAPY